MIEIKMNDRESGTRMISAGTADKVTKLRDSIATRRGSSDGKFAEARQHWENHPSPRSLEYALAGVGVRGGEEALEPVGQGGLPHSFVRRVLSIK